MRKILFFLFIGVSINFSQSQWSVSYLRKPTIPGDFRVFSYTGDALHAIGYDIGAISFYLKSTDLGNTWTSFYSGFNATDNLTAMAFPSSNVGYVAGANGKIYKTTDGGISWVNKSDTTVYNGGFNAAFFLNDSIGYLCGSVSGGKLLVKTTNGGTTWTGITTPITNTAYDMHWDNEMNGWSVHSSARVLRTTDGGTTWSQLTVTGATGTLYKIKKVSTSVFYVCGINVIGKSTDGGVTFTALTSPTTSALYTAEFYDENTGYVFGSNGIAYYTTNGGTGWTLVPSFTSEVIRTSIKIGNSVYAGAYKSNLAKTTSAGGSWSLISNTYRDFYGIYAENPTTLVIVGDRGEVHITTNAGENWRKSAFMTGNLLYDAYKNNNNIYVCGRVGGYFISSDNGLSWQDQSFGSATTRNYKLAFFDENNGLMTTNDGTILTTTNKGVDWTAAATFTGATFYDIKMSSPQQGFAVGSLERIYYTAPGVPWTHSGLATIPGQLTGVFMLTPAIGFACGENGAVYKTNDGFATVTLMTDTIALYGRLIHDVYAFDENTVVAVGAGGLILTSNGPNSLGVFDTTYRNIDLTAIARLGSGNRVLAITGTKGVVLKLVQDVVPVELVSFKGSVENGIVMLQWETASESNNKGFDIEKSFDNLTFTSIGFVPGFGTSSEKHSYTFTDAGALGAKLFYRLRQTDYDGSFEYSDVIAVENVLPVKAVLGQNYPNPFNPSTTIEFTVPVKSYVSITLFDALGEKVAELFNDEAEAGTHHIKVQSDRLSAGVYIYRMVNGSHVLSRKMTVLK